MSDRSNSKGAVDPGDVEPDHTSPQGGTAPAAGIPPASNPSPSEREPPQSRIPINTPSSETTSSGYVLIGPSKSGKTTLLTAMERACQLPVDDNLDLVFSPHEETSKLIRAAYHRIAGKERTVEASAVVSDFPFRIDLTCESNRFWIPDNEVDMDVVMSDGPGGHLFPIEATDLESERFRRVMVERISRAKAVVLCVDATDCNLPLVDTELGRLLAETTRPREIEHTIRFRELMQNRVGVPVRDLKRRFMLGRNSRQRHHSPGFHNGNGNRARPNENGTRVREQQCLVADRFLLLLTQIDKLCDRFPNELLPIDVAKMIDPIAQARHLLGPSFLNRIFKAISPNGQVAIGICSSMGFHPDTGTPFSNRFGIPFSWPSELGNELLRSWTPFGVREAIYFMATGNCRGTVRKLTKENLLQVNGSSEIYKEFWGKQRNGSR
jgi:hypothetical protein